MKNISKKYLNLDNNGTLNVLCKSKGKRDGRKSTHKKKDNKNQFKEGLILLS